MKTYKQLMVKQSKLWEQLCKCVKCGEQKDWEEIYAFEGVCEKCHEELVEFWQKKALEEN